MAIGITRFSRFGANLGRLTLLSARHAEGLDATDELAVTCYEDLNKGEYLVWRDGQGYWHEHIVDVPHRTHDDSGRPTTTATCINSINETWDDYITDKRPRGTVFAALTSIMEGTRWEVGACTQEGENSHTYYHKSVREGITETQSTWGGELVTEIECDGSQVTRRKVSIVAARGNQTSARRFTWTKDLISISRRVDSDNPKTRIYAYGKGEEIEDTGGYGRRIGIEDVNDGLPYVEDADATAIWGHIGPSGTVLPAEGTYVNEQCEDPEQLLQEALDYLETAKEPKVTYQADVIDLAAFGRDWEGVSLGDLVTIVDRGFSDDGIRLHGRVSKIERDLLTNDTTVTFGTLVDALASPWQALQAKVASLSGRSLNWDQTSDPSSAWLDLLIAALNAQYDAAGTYRYYSFEQGDIWSNVPLDEDGHATVDGGWAMNINGMGFRLANTLNPDGSWAWRAFGNGNGFTADLINAGVIRGGNNYWNLNTGDMLFTQGGIRSGDGSNYWNLTTGELRIAPSAVVGDRTLEDALAELDSAVVDVDVEYAQGDSATVAPKTGWSTAAPAWQADKYVWSRTATTTEDGTTVYSDPTCISGAHGLNQATVYLYQRAASAPTAPTTALVYVFDTSTLSGTLGDWTRGIPSGSDPCWVIGAVASSNTNTDTISPNEWSAPTMLVQDGQDGDDGIGISSTTISYGTSESASTSPQSWQASVPSLAQGQWLWVRTVYTYTDGSDKTAYSKSYIGTDGEDGVSVAVRSATKSGGVTTVVLEDSEGNTTTLTINDGDDGDVGQAGANGYVHTAWANSADGSTDFSTSVSADKRYLGVYSDNTAADSQAYTDYSWSLIKGADGQDGDDGLSHATIYLYQRAASAPLTPLTASTYTFATGLLSATGSWDQEIPAHDGNPCWVTLAVAISSDATVSIPASAWSSPVKLAEDGEQGIGISAIVEEYYLSTSSIVPSGGSWSASPQAYVDGRYYWTRSRITWSDGTETLSTPVLAAGLNSANSNAAAAQQSVLDLSTQQAIFNLLTNNGQTQGIYLKNGLVYINGQYLQIGTITSADRNSYWDLDNNTLVTKNMNAVDMTATGTITSSGQIYDIQEASYLPYVGKLDGGKLQTYYNGTEVGSIKAAKLAAAYIGGVMKTYVLGMLIGYSTSGDPIYIMESPANHGLLLRAGMGSGHNEQNGTIDAYAYDITMNAANKLALNGTIKRNAITSSASGTFWVKDTNGTNHMVMGPFFMS